MLEGRFSDNPALGRFHKVAKIIHADTCSWPRLPTENMRNLADNIPNYELSSATEDKVVWCVEKEEEFTVQKAWNFFRSCRPIVSWHSIVWYPKPISRHSFILWLAVQERLSTQNKLLNYGVTISFMCVLSR